MMFDEVTVFYIISLWIVWIKWELYAQMIIFIIYGNIIINLTLKIEFVTALFSDNHIG